MMKWLRNLFGSKLQSLNWVELNCAALRANYQYLQSLKPDDLIMPVLKSNAYGHGLHEICSMMKPLKPQIVVVDSYPEYQIVRDCLDSDILVIGEMHHSVYRKLDHRRVILAVYTIHTLRHLISLGKPWRVHVFVNTGMNREGIQARELDEWLDTCLESTIQLEGVMSHLAYADSGDVSAINTQVEYFKTMYDVVLSFGFSPLHRHINNSAGLLSCNDDFWTAHRCGLALYGYDPLQDKSNGHELRPVMSIWSSVITLQHLQVGDTVGYDGAYEVSEEIITATIPFGYAEGLARGVQNHRAITHAGGKLSCAGRISMNLSSWIAGDAVHIGDEVCVISDKLTDDNSFVNFAQHTGSIVYEALVKIDRSMRRKII